MKSPYQILTFAYHQGKEGIEYLILKKKDSKCWRGITGDGEEGETILETAKREVLELTGISKYSKYIKLDTTTSIPVENVVDRFLWGEKVYVINQYSFGVEVLNKNIVLSDEDIEYLWTSYESAIKVLKIDSNKTALWELNRRLLDMGKIDAKIYMTIN